MMKKLLCSLLFTVLAVGFVQGQFGNISGGSPLQVIPTTATSPGTNTPIAADGTDLGTVSVGGSINQTYTFTNLAGGGYILGTTALTGDFAINSPTPGVNIGPGTTSTFTVTFTPTTAGLQTRTIEFLATDGATSENYYYQIQGTGSAGVPELVVTGDDNAPISHFELTTPGDNTDFGQAVANVETVTRSFTITNDISAGADLLISSIALFPPTNAHYTIVLPPNITDPIPPGFSITFDIEFSPTSVGAPLTSFISIQSNYSTPNFLYQVSGEGIAGSPDMDVFGNSTLISSGDTTPTTADHTVFPDVDIADGGVTRTFTIENNGTADLNLTSLSPIVDITGVDAADFTVTTNPTTPIAAGGSTTFVVTFDPTTVGVKDATIEINNDGVDNPYTFAIQGTAIDGTVGGGSPLMITQYYEGTSSINNWIEVKNISSNATIAGSYNLALFLNSNATTTGGIATNNPDEVVAIPSLAAGEVIIFSRASATLPSASNLGAATIVTTEVCTFTGNDVIVISTSSEGNTYNDRIDIVGVVGTNSAVDWGTDISIIKGCGTTEEPSTTYNPFEFLELTLDEVDNADSNTNIALGTQTIGSTTWTTSWSNGIPDRTKETIINGTYANSNGSFESCNLTINSGSSINLDSGGSGSNYVLVDQNLTIGGSFTIGDTESLVMTDPDAVISGTISKIERTTPLNNFRDYTYWSSPVSTTIASAFTGVDPNRIWLWRTPSSGDTGNWEVASGSMIEGRGYLAEAPSSITTGQQHQVTFTGTPNNGLVDVTVGIDLTNGDGYGGYNIIGNPYPSAIDIDLFLQDQANVELNNANTTTTDATIWLWTHGTQIDGGTTGEFTAADYATYNLVGGVGSGDDEGTGVTPTNIIGSSQGFLIRVLTPGNNEVTFENSMRVRGQNDTQFFKSSTTTLDKDRVWLNMTNEDNGFNQILLGFMDEATDGYDRGYDGLSLSSGNIVFYSMIEDDIYAIQGFGGFDEAREIPLGFYAAQENMHKISINKSEGVLVDQDIYLVDNELNLVHDLKQGAYEFEVTASGNYKERFVLQFNSGVLSTDDVVLNNSFIVYNEDATLKIKAGVEISRLKVYDVTGRLLIDSEPKSTAFDVLAQNIKAGTVLILNATMKDGSSISKKAIKY